ncbi:diacylglycerol/lipid kinase family protein [Cellulomonas marina]|uniref:Diacylglycerol kinase (ATP) n=1 Tax=Cellulomonas marina TaxID=988821 RepID=A0A1I0WBN4_9CELL|nr:diacylglycerol kinase family protein [Cellulomonas marina]GIG29078.1 sphingosine kinase [Cellulomonas marina]SFA85433.1 diacylglycerol kinase (ATP) [Cellulomonas marina]
MSRLVLVVNGAAGSGRARHAGRHVEDALVAAGHEVIDASGGTAPDGTPDETPHDARGRARAALDDTRADALVVVGGDGAVHLGVGLVAGTDVALGVVAHGSGDDVARALGLPRHDTAAAVARIDAGLRTGARRVDATLLDRADGGHEWAVGVVSCGLDAAVNARANAQRWPPGPARCLRALAGELRRFRPYGYRLTGLDEADRPTEVLHEGPATLVALAGTPWFGGGLHVAPGADLTDGLVDVLVAGPLTRRQVVAVFPRLYRGSHLGHPAVRVHRVAGVLVEPLPGPGTPAPPPAFADGEPVGPLPLRARVVPGALHVLA